MSKFVKQYGENVKLVLEVNGDNLVERSTVEYKTSKGGYWKEHLVLECLAGNKIIDTHHPFTGADWSLFENLSTAQAEAFYAHGEDIDCVLIDDLREK